MVALVLGDVANGPSVGCCRTTTVSEHPVEIRALEAREKRTITGPHLPVIGGDHFQIAVAALVAAAGLHGEQRRLLDRPSPAEHVSQIVIERFPEVLKVPANRSHHGSGLPANL